MGKSRRDSQNKRLRMSLESQRGVRQAEIHALEMSSSLACSATLREGSQYSPRAGPSPVRGDPETHPVLSFIFISLCFLRHPGSIHGAE